MGVLTAMGFDDVFWFDEVVFSVVAFDAAVGFSSVLASSAAAAVVERSLVGGFACCVSSRVLGAGEGLSQAHKKIAGMIQMVNSK